MAIFLSPEFEKQFLPMVLTDEGIEMCSRLVQPSKQYSPNNVTVEGTFIVIRLVQGQDVLLVDYQYYTL